MSNLLNKIIENNTIFAIVIVALVLVLALLVILIIKSVRENKKINIYEEELEDEDIKKVKNVKKEDIIEEPENDLEESITEEVVLKEEPTREKLEEIKDEEIEQRYEEEKVKEIKEVKEEKHSAQIQELLDKMERESKLSPEDVVANFEKEQEAQSIISYKELVNAVKNRPDEYYEDELESKPLKTVSDYLKQKEEQEKAPIDFSDDLDDYNIKEEVEEDIVEEKKVEPKEESTKFKRTEVISPIYGRMETKKEDKELDYSKTIDLRDLDLSDEDFNKDNSKNETAMAELDDIYKRMADEIIKKSEETGETTSLDALTKNEEFLQSLKDFRKNL